MIKIIWSPQAKKDYWQNIDYLLDSWTKKEAAHFIDLVEQSIFLIQKNPKLFQLTDFINVRRAFITPQITLFYRIVNNKKIELIRFWNNYQNPDTLNL